jgi:hypothetical protein
MNGLRPLLPLLLALPLACQEKSPAFRLAEFLHPGQVIILLTEERKQDVPAPPDRENPPGAQSSIHSASLDQFPDALRPKLGTRYFAYPRQGGVTAVTLEAPVIIEGCSDAWLGARARAAGPAGALTGSNPEDLRSLYLLASSESMRRGNATIEPVTLTPAQSQWLRRELTAHMKSALPKVEERSAPAGEEWKARDQQLRAGRFELQSRVEQIRFPTRTLWFVRAFFKVGNAGSFLLWALVHPGATPRIEQIDDSLSSAIRAPDWGSPDFLSLNLVSELVGVYHLGGSDYLLVRESGLESFAVILYRYVDGGLRDVATLYSTGC